MYQTVSYPLDYSAEKIKEESAPVLLNIMKILETAVEQYELNVSSLDEPLQKIQEHIELSNLPQVEPTQIFNNSQCFAAVMERLVVRLDKANERFSSSLRHLNRII